MLENSRAFIVGSLAFLAGIGWPLGLLFLVQYILRVDFHVNTTMPHLLTLTAILGIIFGWNPVRLPKRHLQGFALILSVGCLITIYQVLFT